ncbi:hypothetical protein TWF730_007884 [Orbilia blumenaviensis]|uniref:DUF6697 domain-containing protein n=1 Tax=Orbilia blumenaviensis TaxID=1796055 RepID=A0AAV9V9A7_9PEZI
MGSSWRPSFESGSLPQIYPLDRHRDRHHDSRRLSGLNSVRTPPQSREQSREFSLPRIPSPVCTTSRVADLYRPGDSIFRSTPPTSPNCRGHQSLCDQRREEEISPLCGSEDGELRDGDSDAVTAIEMRDTPPKSPVKFEVPTRNNNTPAKDKNIFRKHKGELDRLKGGRTGTTGHIKGSQQWSKQLQPRPKQNHHVPSEPKANRGYTPLNPCSEFHQTKYNDERKKDQLRDHGSRRSPVPIDPDSLGTYPNNLAVARPRFPRSDEVVDSQGKKWFRSQGMDDDMGDAPSSAYVDLSELLKDKPVVVKRVRDSGCQEGLSSHSPSYFAPEKDVNPMNPQGTGEDTDMQDVRDRGISTCLVSIVTPKLKLGHLPSETAPRSVALGNIDLDTLVSRLTRDIVGELKETLGGVKLEKIETPAIEDKMEVCVTEPKKEKRYPDERVASVDQEDLGDSQSLERRFIDFIPQPTTRKRLERRISKPRAESSDEDGNGEAFQRKRKRGVATFQQREKRSPSPSYSDKYGGEPVRPKPRTPADLRFRKRTRVEALAVEERSKTRSPSIAFSTSGSPCPFERRASHRGQGTPPRFRERMLVENSTSKPVKNPQPHFSATRKAAAGASRRVQGGPLPDTFWFQRYYNLLCSKTDQPHVPTENRRLFNRRMLSHYLGGNARSTVSSVSPSARISQIHRVRFVVAIKKEFVPNPTKPGEIIVISSPHNFMKDLPPDVSSFPVFLERGVAEWEYMGTYEFDGWKLFSNKEATHLQDKNLIDFWLPRLFEMRQEAEEGRDTVQKIQKCHIRQDSGKECSLVTLCDKAVSSLAPQLVPSSLRSKNHVRKLTLRQVERYFQEGTLKFNWNFLRPVGYDNVLFKKLSEARWPPKKKMTGLGIWSSLRDAEAT